MSHTSREVLQIYCTALDYLASLERLDADSFETLDRMLEPTGTAMGAEARRQMIEVSANLLPDPDRNMPGGIESLRKFIRDNLKNMIIALDDITRAELDGTDAESGEPGNAPVCVPLKETERPGSEIYRAGVERFICLSSLQDGDSGKEQSSFFVIDADGKFSREISRSASGERFSSFSVSPDRRWLVYTCLVQRNERGDAFPQLRALSIETRKQSVLTPWDEHLQPCYFNPVVSSRGDRLVCQFGLKDPYNPNLLLMNLAEVGDSLFASNRVSIVNPYRIGNHSPQFMPDGERVIYFGNYAYEDLLELCLWDPKTDRAELTGAVGQRMTENGDGVWHRPRAIIVQPEWEQVFFIRGHMSSKEEIGVVLLSDIRSEIVVKVFQSVGGKRHRISGLQVSPDGRWLAFDADGAVYKVATDGSALQRVSLENTECRSPAFSPDGENLAFIGDSKLTILNLSTGDLSRLTGGPAVAEFAWIQR